MWKRSCFCTNSFLQCLQRVEAWVMRQMFVQIYQAKKLNLLYTSFSYRVRWRIFKEKKNTHWKKKSEINLYSYAKISSTFIFKYALPSSGQIYINCTASAGKKKNPNPHFSLRSTFTQTWKCVQSIYWVLQSFKRTFLLNIFMDIQVLQKHCSRMSWKKCKFWGRSNNCMESSGPSVQQQINTNVNN